MIDVKQLLSERFNVDNSDIEKATAYQEKHAGRLESILINMGCLTEDDLAVLYHELLNIDLFNPAAYPNWQPLDSVDFVHHQALKNFDAILLNSLDNCWLIACKDPLNAELSQYIIQQNVDAKVLIATESQLQTFFFEVQSRTEANIDDEELSGDEEARLRELASEAPTVNLLNSLITKALARNASDMHLEPHKGRFRVRYRIDGVLHEVESLAPKMQLPITTRLKILSGMDIAEKRRPQDGKIGMRIANQDLDIRVSALPLNEGESIVLRFLRKDSIRYDMSVLGLSKDNQKFISEDLKTTTGVVLLTGPTGSGKTTTLYTFLNELNNEDVKIITLEDPVEYQLEGINQVQVNPDIGFDFSAGLRSIVRQDPDIIMVGEIRDKETAQIALQSALTGHLVFSTVHTNDAASAYTRLLDLGVEEFLLNAALVSVVAQRLARRLCPHCASDETDVSELLLKYPLQEIALNSGVETITIKRAVGCEHCNGSGYKGRIAINEYLRCDSDIKAIPKDDQFIPRAKAHNASLKRRDLMQDGFYKVITGVTTIDEVLRVAG
ncbi:GspE/PulE family protein [Pseudoalteromonas aurantia]|uniref:Type II secretion system protein GspE n=1 Tax=Pseudoalteromonas aurantia TaxID=43654 RepID=A0A5S3VCS6_9GAMM|nr:GspE/PulE family protein [Pseudoalteromonas aurantia]TMO69999.1 type II secretion system protein GspE [Pseudoalteromonas aurantia]TMO75939.1 type II secretion system protein GspE [Pseudoalteromonas aurantia]